jgi:hypothetical protein
VTAAPPFLDAVRGALHTTRQVASSRGVLLAGAGGPLGAAVLEQLLGGGFDGVQVLVDGAISPAMRGFVPVDAAALLDDRGARPGARAGAVARAASADTAVVVFDRTRHSHGREEVFHRPSPQAMPALCAALQAQGVARLLLVWPHAPGLLPQALKQGLASMDEQAVAAMGFEQLVFVRLAQSARSGPGRAAAPWPARLADALLSQLHWMVPQGDQPLRAATVAAVVATLARVVGSAPPGTRVMPPELLWQLARAPDTEAATAAWLHGVAPAAPLPARTRW